MIRSLSTICLVFLTVGCLKTREQLQGNQSGSMRTDASGSYVAGANNMGTQQRAQIDSRFFEIDRDFRNLYGKIEVLEQKISDSKTSAATDNAAAGGAKSEDVKALEKRISTLEEALLAIDKKLAKMSGDKSGSISSQPPRGLYARGEWFYKKGNYEKAIQSYDEYRRRFPKGRKYAQATLKMGLCFQKLKMNQDAKAFYKEVIQRYPNTKVSIRAEANLKSI